MTVGKASGNITSLLNIYRGTSYTGVATPFVQLHTADPGAAGTTAVSAVTTRNAITWNAPSSNQITLNTLGTWTMTTSETISHVSLWTASTAGTFLESFALTAGVPVVNGSILTINTFTLGYTPVAA